MDILEMVHTGFEKFRAHLDSNRIERSWNVLEKKVAMILATLSDDELNTFLQTGMVFDSGLQVIRVSPDLPSQIHSKVADLFSGEISGGILGASTHFVLKEQLQKKRNINWDTDVTIAVKPDLPLVKV